MSAFLCLHSGAKGSGVELSGISRSPLKKTYSFACECVWGPRWWSEHNSSVSVLSCHCGISWGGTRVLMLGCTLLHPENHLASPISSLHTLSHGTRPLSMRPHALFVTFLDISSLIESHGGWVSYQSGFTRGNELIG